MCYNTNFTKSSNMHWQTKLLTKLHSAQGVFLATYQHGHKQKKKKKKQICKLGFSSRIGSPFTVQLHKPTQQRWQQRVSPHHGHKRNAAQQRGPPRLGLSSLAPRHASGTRGTFVWGAMSTDTKSERPNFTRLSAPASGPAEGNHGRNAYF